MSDAVLEAKVRRMSNDLSDCRRRVSVMQDENRTYQMQIRALARIGIHFEDQLEEVMTILTEVLAGDAEALKGAQKLVDEWKETREGVIAS